jgi:putative transposase
VIVLPGAWSGHPVMNRASRGDAEVTAADRQAAAARQRRHTTALWRWALAGPAMDPALTSRQRGQLVRDLASREHAGPDGRKVAVSRRTLDR